MLKKIITILLIILANIFLAFAQEKTNTYFLGGTFGFDFSNS